jgi:hypothetical protein
MGHYSIGIIALHRVRNNAGYIYMLDRCTARMCKLQSLTTNQEYFGDGFARLTKEGEYKDLDSLPRC